MLPISEKEFCILFEALEFVPIKFMKSCLYNGVSVDITEAEMKALHMKMQWVLGKINDKEDVKELKNPEVVCPL